jgi:peptidoglycan/xylan/chitin deacetylase (PgdA/CDA1 family)
MTPTLMYHDVVPAGQEDSSGFPGRDAALYKVTPKRFASHLDAITQTLGRSRRVPFSPAPRRTGNLPCLAEAPAAKAETPGITVDDGGASALVVADALERYGFRGHFFVTVDYIGTRGFLDPAGIRELQRRGHTVGSHSCSHPLRMGHLSAARLRHEWTTSRAALNDILGEDVRTASLPGGDFAPWVAIAAADAGFRHLFTSEPTLTVRQIGSITITGRFTIQRWTSATTAAALAAGRWLPCARQFALWNVKKLGKQIAGERYLELRRVLLRHDREVRWGDRGSDFR